MEIDKMEKSGESIESQFPAFSTIFLDRVIVEAPCTAHLKGLDMRNLQYEIRICQKHHTKVTITISKEYPF